MQVSSTLYTVASTNVTTPDLSPWTIMKARVPPQRVPWGAQLGETALHITYQPWDAVPQWGDPGTPSSPVRPLHLVGPGAMAPWGNVGAWGAQGWKTPKLQKSWTVPMEPLDPRKKSTCEKISTTVKKRIWFLQ